MSAPASDRTLPLPARPWTVFMRWHKLLFAHWPVPADALRPLIPPSLTIDRFEGQAWIGVVPFYMTGIRRRLLPAVPGLCAFPEVNVRTYVVSPDGRPGVWFLSLDAAHRIGVRVARWWYHLLYYDARIRVDPSRGDVDYRSTRRPEGNPAVAFIGRYRPIGPAVAASPGTLDHWLTARYALFSSDAARTLYRGEIDHAPWSLQPAEAEIRHNTMCGPLGVRLPDTAPLLHYSERLDTRAWTVEKLLET